VNASTGPVQASADSGVEALFRVEYRPMHVLAFTILESDSSAEEVVQEAFLAVADRWASLENPGGYLRVSVVNGARKMLRTQASRSRTEHRAAAESHAGEAASGTYLLDVLSELPERQQIAVVLTYYAGLNSGEASEYMDCPAATVRSLVRRALKSMAEVVEQ